MPRLQKIRLPCKERAWRAGGAKTRLAPPPPTPHSAQTFRLPKGEGLHSISPTERSQTQIPSAICSSMELLTVSAATPFVVPCASAALPQELPPPDGAVIAAATASVIAADTTSGCFSALGAGGGRGGSCTGSAHGAAGGIAEPSSASPPSGPREDCTCGGDAAGPPAVGGGAGWELKPVPAPMGAGAPGGTSFCSGPAPAPPKTGG